MPFPSLTAPRTQWPPLSHPQLPPTHSFQTNHPHLIAYLPIPLKCVSPNGPCVYAVHHHTQHRAWRLDICIDVCWMNEIIYSYNKGLFTFKAFLKTQKTTENNTSITYLHHKETTVWQDCSLLQVSLHPYRLLTGLF